MGIYDNGDNSWLRCKNSKGEWAIAYHGVKNPNISLKSIMDGLFKGEMLVPGLGQAYSESKCINIPNQTVGKGVYFSPHLMVSVGYAPQVTKGN
jgi:hypothetical protein